MTMGEDKNEDPIYRNDENFNLQPSQKNHKNAIQTTYFRNDQEIQDSLNQLDELYFFFKTAPVQWSPNQLMRRYYLNEELGFVTCILWNKLFYVTGTDIVKACIYQMELFGRHVVQRKKFEEGIFSDLRNLKCGKDAVLEQSKSTFLKFLFKNVCLKTQKKQKIFFWFKVPYLQLFIDALNRDLKREESNRLATTVAVSEPAISFKYDSNSNISLMDQLISYLNNGKLNGFTNIVSDLEDEEDENNNYAKTNNNNNNKRSRTNTNKFTKGYKRKRSTSTKPNLYLPLKRYFADDKTEIEDASAAAATTTIQSTFKSINNDSSDSNSIVTHTLMLQDNQKSDTHNNNSNNDHTQSIVYNVCNENLSKIGGFDNRQNIIIDKNMKDDNILFSPLNFCFTGGLNNLNDKDFPLDYLPIIDDVFQDNKQERNNKTCIPLTKGIPVKNTDEDKFNNQMGNNNNSNKGEENIVVPVKVENFDKGNESFVDKHQMTNKEYYMLNKEASISNELKNLDYNEEVEATVVPNDIETNKNNAITNNNNIKNNKDKKFIDEDPSIAEGYEYEYFVKEAIDYDKEDNPPSPQIMDTTSLRITDPLPIQENAFSIPDEYSYWGNTMLPIQSYNMSMNQNAVPMPPPPPPPPHQSMYTNSMTPVTKFNPYILQSPWVPAYLSNSLYGVNSPPRIGRTVSQPYQTLSINPYSRPSSSVTKKFPVNKNKTSGKPNVSSPTHKIKKQKT